MSILRRVTRALRSDPVPTPRGAKGARAYAVGDIHGRLDLLDAMLSQIEEDLAARPCARTFLIFLGDLIDRGPQSAEVVERLRGYRHPGVELVFLAGNHEEVLLRIIDGEADLVERWLGFGGAECARSYGLDPHLLASLPGSEAAERVRAAIPAAHRTFLADFADTFRFGDYLFVHAGLRPGIPLDEQSPRDLRWIRDPFLSDTGAHGFVVVHGHTVVDGVDERPNRIGIDTGACRSGILTTLVVEGETRRYLDTAPAEACLASALADRVTFRSREE